MVLNTAEQDDKGNVTERTDIDQGCENEMNKQDSENLGNKLSAVDQESDEIVKINMQESTTQEPKDADAGKEVREASESSLALDSEKLHVDDRCQEDESPINSIHSEILELTRKLSLPETGLLNLIRATEEAENEAKRQSEAAIAASPSKESLLLRAMAEHGSTDFSVYGALRGTSPRDPKALSTSPSKVPKTPVVPSSTNLQSEALGKASIENESLNTSPRKDRGATMNSESVVTGDVASQMQRADDLSKTAGKETEAKRSEVTSDRDLLGMLQMSLLIFQIICKEND